MAKLYTEQRELAAIWLKRPMKTPQGNKVRITAGDMVKVEVGELVDFTDEPTHKIIACFGTLNSQFELTLIDLKTNEPMQLKL